MSFNKKWAKSVSEKVFVETHKHLIPWKYADEDALKAVYKKLNGGNEVAKAEEK